jgi:hypothetical protein
LASALVCFRAMPKWKWRKQKASTKQRW